MPAKPAMPKAQSRILSNTDPVAKAGDYKSIAAQYAKAKALKEEEDAAAGTKQIGTTAKGNGRVPVGNNGKIPLTETERVNMRKESIFKKTWNSAFVFFVWLL
jgi:hypothetical protein